MNNFIAPVVMQKDHSNEMYYTIPSIRNVNDEKPPSSEWTQENHVDSSLILVVQNVRWFSLGINYNILVSLHKMINAIATTQNAEGMQCRKHAMQTKPKNIEKMCAKMSNTQNVLFPRKPISS